MPLSRRAFLRASAAAALTAACSPRPDAAPTDRTATRSAATPSGRSPAASRPSTIDPQTARRTVEVRHGSRTSPLVALTFHGNGDVSLARRLLGVLEKAGVHGTVLAVGTWLKAEPAMAGWILDAGHDLGNHTLHHYPMRSLAAGAAFDEIEGCARVLRSTSGSRGAWFRASGTQLTTPTIRRAAGRAGYDRCISYDVDGLDWQDPSARTVVKAVLDGARRGSIVSLHLGHPVTLTALPDILDGLRSQHLRPVTLTELLG